MYVIKYFKSCEPDELFHSGSPLTKNLYFTLQLSLFRLNSPFLLSVLGQPSESVK